MKFKHTSGVLLPGSRSSASHHGCRRVTIVVLILTAVALGSPAGVADELETQIDQAVRQALPWLANAQRPSGAWTTGQTGESTAATSLAILAFLAAGHVPDEGPWGHHLTRGIGWILQQQDEEGLLVGPSSSHGPMYSHGITTLMLAEVSGMVNSNQVTDCRRVLQRAVKLIVDAQNQPKSDMADGGWRYKPTSRDSDLSVTAWQLLALRAARDIGCDVPVENIDRAIAYIRRLSVPDRGGFGYTSARGSTVTRAGTGIVALEVCGEHRTRETLAAAQYILSHPLTRNEGYFYYGAYYCTVGMYKVGGDEWQTIRPALYSVILNTQDPEGYWVPPAGNESEAGRVYATSMSILALAVEYAYLPIYQR